MKVLKFGGTSVGSVDSILSLKKIVEDEATNQEVVIVVSALGGITDKLIATSNLALKGDESWKDEFDGIVQRHHQMIDSIIPDKIKAEELRKIINSTKLTDIFCAKPIEYLTKPPPLAIIMDIIESETR